MRPSSIVCFAIVTRQIEANRDAHDAHDAQHTRPRVGMCAQCGPHAAASKTGSSVCRAAGRACTVGSPCMAAGKNAGQLHAGLFGNKRRPGTRHCRAWHWGLGQWPGKHLCFASSTLARGGSCTPRLLNLFFKNCPCAKAAIPRRAALSEPDTHTQRVVACRATRAAAQPRRRLVSFLLVCAPTAPSTSLLAATRQPARPHPCCSSLENRSW